MSDVPDDIRSNPFGYECPDCGASGSSIYVLKGGQAAPGDYPHGEKGKRQRRLSAAKRYSCKTCEEQKLQIRDSETGELIGPTEAEVLDRSR